MHSSDQPKRWTSALTAARGSFLAPSISLLIIICLGRLAHGGRVLSDVLVLLVNVFGLGLGIAALFGIRKYGARAILPQVLIGFVLSGLLLSMWCINFCRARGVSPVNRNYELGGGQCEVANRP